jgi:hypothetical protein
VVIKTRLLVDIHNWMEKHYIIGFSYAHFLEGIAFISIFQGILFIAPTRDFTLDAIKNVSVTVQIMGTIATVCAFFVAFLGFIFRFLITIKTKPAWNKPFFIYFDVVFYFGAIIILSLAAMDSVLLSISLSNYSSANLFNTDLLNGVNFVILEFVIGTSLIMFGFIFTFLGFIYDKGWSRAKKWWGTRQEKKNLTADQLIYRDRSENDRN